MCGIAGALQPDVTPEKWRSRLEAMGAALIHRGPDDGGIWLDAEAGVGLANRRLAIVDLSPAGHQPMVSESQRYFIAYNGEIYNFRILREQLKLLGCRFRGHSDTEVILAAVDQWGLEAAITKFVGMFAFALWDSKERTLYLVRDRLGIKPLYFSRWGNTLLFASELKALKPHPQFRPQIDRQALWLLLQYGYVPAPYSIYEGTRKLRAGTILKVCPESRQLSSRRYWSVTEIADEGVKNPFQGDLVMATDCLEALLREAVRIRMVADVPVGAFLSGGIDSSTVVALMQSESNQPVKTFTIGFENKSHDESSYARGVARHLGTDHTELYITGSDARDLVPQLPTIYDEPFADPSQIPTLLMSMLARQRVKVSLSGDGGDELFGGYPRYHRTQNIWRFMGLVPYPVRVTAAGVLSMLPTRILNFGVNWIPIPGSNPLGQKVERLSEILALKSPEALYRTVMSDGADPSSLVVGSEQTLADFPTLECWSSLPKLAERMMCLDTVTYLPDDILTKVDRATMSVGLEARVPLLDHRVVEFAWKLPLAMKLGKGKGKWVLRCVLDRHVPQELLNPRKHGFGVPLDAWLRGPLREWGDELLEYSHLRAAGFFYPEAVREKWSEHLSGKRNWSNLLWSVLMFQQWQAN